MSVERLIIDFNERGLQNLLGSHHPPVPRQEAVAAPAQSMRTRTGQKKDKGELRSKRNQDRQSKNPPAEMDPEEAVESSTEEENLGPQHPPYLAPILARVKPPRQLTKFSLLTPSLPKVVSKEGSMVERVDKLKYSDHDTNDRENFP